VLQLPVVLGRGRELVRHLVHPCMPAQVQGKHAPKSKRESTTMYRIENSCSQLQMMCEESANGVKRTRFLAARKEIQVWGNAAQYARVNGPIRVLFRTNMSAGDRSVVCYSAMHLISLRSTRVLLQCGIWETAGTSPGVKFSSTSATPNNRTSANPHRKFRPPQQGQKVWKR
jgi:hypothetical protein